MKSWAAGLRRKSTACYGDMEKRPLDNVRRNRDMNASRIFQTVVLSALFLAGIFVAAFALDQLISNLYGPGDETTRYAEPFMATALGRTTENKQPTGELNPTQWVKPIRVGEGFPNPIGGTAKRD